MNVAHLKGKSVLITGGTGSFGSSFVRVLLKESQAKRIIVFSRDELKQSRMSHEMEDERLRFFIGDVRDLERLQRAFSGVDIVVHAAALKHVPILEYNPFEAVKTNILGSQNVIEAALDQGVKQVVLVSTDKAVYPSNLYGSTKLTAEKLFVAANSYAARKTAFGVVRYGNVLGSRGSIVDVLKQDPPPKLVQVTDPAMTRFWISMPQAHELVLFALEHMRGGEIFIPKLPSMKLTDLLDTLVPKIPRKVTGIRPGEKLHEMLLTDQESRHAVELAQHYIILPEFPYWDHNDFKKTYPKAKPTKEGFAYRSDTNPHSLTQKELRTLMRK
jgi:UDP-N-acetylglucosamine 4,6-dehydratase